MPFCFSRIILGLAMTKIFDYTKFMAEIYHIVSRGVDKRKIFLDNRDYFRFIHDLFEFNNKASADTASYYFSKLDIASGNYTGEERKPRKLLVSILAFCLMPNHYHLILISKIEGGIPKFMKKLNMGYAKYFNRRYERTGALFESRYKSVLIKDEAHFIHLPYYVHLNPLDLISPEWRDRKLRNYRKAMDFLNSYRWSSHLDYLGKKNFPSITQRDFLLGYFGGNKGYGRRIKEFLEEFNSSAIQDIVLEQ